MIQKNAVSGQNENNFLKSTAGELGCCPDSKVDCQYTATYTQANSVSALTLTENGVDVVLPLTIAGAATAAAVQTALLVALALAGYYDDEDDTWAGVVVTDLGTTLQIVITGNIVVKSLTASGGTSTFDGDCTISGQCTFTVAAFTAGAGSVAHINGVAYALGTLTPGTTSNADVKTALDAAFASAGVTTGTIVVTNATSVSFTFVIPTVESDTTMYFVGASGVAFYGAKSACAQVYL